MTLDQGVDLVRPKTFPDVIDCPVIDVLSSPRSKELDVNRMELRQGVEYDVVQIPPVLRTPLWHLLRPKISTGCWPIQANEPSRLGNPSTEDRCRRETITGCRTCSHITRQIAEMSRLASVVMITTTGPILQVVWKTCPAEGLATSYTPRGRRTPSR